MNPIIWATLISSLATSTIITMTSNHWLLAWLGLELNTLSILPLIMKPHHPRATEATTKYFLIQATAAAIILFATTTNAWHTGQWTITHTTPTAATLITIAIMLKLGLAPTHLWYPGVLQGSTLYTALIISTWQKIAPLTLLYLTHNHLNHTILLLIGLLSAAVGGMAGLNQTQTRKIMAFSSIAHMGWLITAMTMTPSLATLMMIIYLIMTTTMFTLLASTTAKTITDMGTTWPLSPTLLVTALLTLMSLGGLPPLTGFMPKWLILKHLADTGLLLPSTLLLMASLPSLFFYIRITYLTMLTTPPTTTPTKHKWRLTPPTHPTSTTLITATALLLPLTATLHNTL
uniref:NADH-ubiquinone oxidoreductase chain 2 n=2 Tax=Cyrtodactylus chamba TaxID=1554511 RepID=A0A097DB24_9SAUR|nr:NADH dehydrogenase subunit 2 [Cyrtodactylus chamba]